LIRSGAYNAGDSWRTDSWIVNMFPKAFDPCPYNPDWNKTHYDGLVDSWDLSSGLVFINPPYSNVMPWVEVALEKLQYARFNNHKLTIVFLLKHDSSTKWYAKLHEAGAHFLSIAGRLKHGTNKGASFPSVLAVLE
jgi:hypothetical protein